MYFSESEYLFSAKNHPYIDKERVLKYNAFVMETKKMYEKYNSLISEHEKTRDSLSMTLSIVAFFIIFLFILGNSDFHWTAILAVLPFFGFIYMPFYGLCSLIPKDPAIKTLQAGIVEREKWIKAERGEFLAIKKGQAEYWLGLSGHQFEKEIASLYEAYGYEVRLTKGSGDGGIDIFLVDDGTRYGVQCKNYHGAVGPAAVRDLYGAMRHEELDGGIFIASSGYTKGAKEFAEGKPIRLLKIEDILRMQGSLK